MFNQSEIKNRAYCSKCGKIVEARHEERDGKILLIKECPDCGPGEVVVSSDADRYMRKRELVGYHADAMQTCGLNCMGCKQHKAPTLVFIDVTNRCNMNCPICLANIPAMGFRFDPPMAYFEKIFERLSQMDPKPKIQLFGGEPTCRSDLIDIILLAKKKYGLSARVTTNGLRLADEEYCKKLVKTGTQLMYSFDGRNPKIYERTRKHPKAYERKLKGLENLAKYRKSKVTIMCCAGKGVNDEYLGDLVDFCHEGRHYIAALDLIPLTETWGPEKVEVDTTTIEDVERMMMKAVPGIEFIPAGVLYRIKTLKETFELGRLTFGGAHPNCESVSLLVSDGQKYNPLSRYLKTPFMQAVDELLELDHRMGEELPQTLLSRLFGKRGRQLHYGWRLWQLGRKHIDFREIFGGPWKMKTLKILFGLMQGKKAKDLLRANTQCHHILRAIVLPFEESECVESARLVDCPAAFAYEHPETREIRFMPVCAWAIYKNNILRQTTEAYGIDDGTGTEGLTGLKKPKEAEQEESA